ncbi:MAG: hypothetical protein KF820_06405 [Candidatus Paracaedibacteraceae bacterium]|nr:hypothetical protein [Candidatus Paracaedibacteraceae bacterium]
MKKIFWITCLFLTILHAADESATTEPGRSNPLNINGKYFELLVSDQTNSLSQTHLSTFSTQIGECTYSTYTSSDLDDILSRCPALRSPEVFTHHSVFLRGLTKAVPENTTALVFDCLPPGTMVKLSEQGINTKKFIQVSSWVKLDFKKPTTVIITALPEYEAQEFRSDMIKELSGTDFRGKNFIFANIEQPVTLRTNSDEVLSTKPSNTSPERLTQSPESYSQHKITPPEGLFDMDWEY